MEDSRSMCQFALTVKLLLIVAKLHGLSSKSIDFVLAFPQMEVDAELYMDPPIGRELEFGKKLDYTLLLLRNLYGLARKDPTTGIRS